MLTLTAILLIGIGVFHSVLGERYILGPLFRRPLPKLLGSDDFTRRTLRFAWHITTLAWWGIAAMLLWDQAVAPTSLRILGYTFLATGLVALVGSRGRHLSWIVFLTAAGLLLWTAESGPSRSTSADATYDSLPGAAEIEQEVEAAVWAFHAADTSRNAEAVIDLLWPEYGMLADGGRASYEDVANGARAFMQGLDLFATEWSDLRIRVVGPDAAVSSFLFSDSIRAASGELTLSRGPTTLVWERRGTEWRVIYGDADHYPR